MDFHQKRWIIIYKYVIIRITKNKRNMKDEIKCFEENELFL